MEYLQKSICNIVNKRERMQQWKTAYTILLNRKENVQYVQIEKNTCNIHKSKRIYVLFTNHLATTAC